MRFHLEQRFAADVDAVAHAYADPAFYGLIAGGGYPGGLGRPEFLERHDEDGLVRVSVRYRFNGDLSSAARRVVDPAKLSWVEQSEHDLDGRTARFHLVPDNYGDRLRASGAYTFTGDGERCLRVTEGELVVRAPLVAGAVERAIVSGLADHLAAEVAVVEAYLAGERAGGEP